MEIRKYTNLHAFNLLGMSEFWLNTVEHDKNGPFQNATFTSGRGYAHYFGADLKFIEIEYIACERFFAGFILRQAALQELPLACEYPKSKIYCFEENVLALGELPRRYYIIAKDVEIIVHYAGENAEQVFGRSDQVEAGEE